MAGWLYWRIYETSFSKSDFRRRFRQDFDRCMASTSGATMPRFLQDDGDRIVLTDRGSYWLHAFEDLFSIEYISTTVGHFKAGTLARQSAAVGLSPKQSKQSSKQSKDRQCMLGGHSKDRQCILGAHALATCPALPENVGFRGSETQQTEKPACRQPSVGESRGRGRCS